VKYVVMHTNRPDLGAAVSEKRQAAVYQLQDYFASHTTGTGNRSSRPARARLCGGVDAFRAGGARFAHDQRAVLVYVC
jgi:hypothetical protein